MCPPPPRRSGSTPKIFICYMMHENTLSCFRTVRNLWPSHHRCNVTPQSPSISVAEQILWIFINASSFFFSCFFFFVAGVSWLVTWAFKQIAWHSENEALEVAWDKSVFSCSTCVYFLRCVYIFQKFEEIQKASKREREVAHKWQDGSVCLAWYTFLFVF